ncbi:hypothetical protein M231_04166 [Tremella mesenterica]|uniref:Uncharacterized protein n=1 Tax=Tremella mesenterica TaxID=5217 RepID=A0A4Q1BL97_TREME|nr:hypothetical protein M231_04166 [Tremella mesenterica]
MEDVLREEIELIQSSLLPTETLTRGLDNFVVRSTTSELSIHVNLCDYPKTVNVEVKGEKDGREESEMWRGWVRERMKEWDMTQEYPLYQFCTTHFLPLLSQSSPLTSPTCHLDTSNTCTTGQTDVPNVDLTPHHSLLISHHLLSSTKRKHLISLSSQLSLVGFSKTGHPGIMYATGSKEDVTEWVREVKSWNWLALRVRVSVEPIPVSPGDSNAEQEESPQLQRDLEDEQEKLSSNNRGDAIQETQRLKGAKDGARGGKGRGEWTEVEKIGDAIEWMRVRGREKMLWDVGVGTGAVK